MDSYDIFPPRYGPHTGITPMTLQRGLGALASSRTRSSTMESIDMMAVRNSPFSESATLCSKSRSGSSGSEGDFANFDFGFNNSSVMLSPFDGEQETVMDGPCLPSSQVLTTPPGLLAQKESKCEFPGAATGSPQPEGKELTPSPFAFDEFGDTPQTVHYASAERISTAEVERDRLRFEAKYPEIIQAARQMNAALGIRCHKPFTLPFRLPNWDGKPHALIDNLEYYRSIQHGDTLYLNSISFHDLTPDKENGFRAAKLLCYFEAEEMTSLRASFVDLSAFGGGKWTYIVLGFREGGDPNRAPPQLLSIACPIETIQVVGYSAEERLDRRGYHRKNVRVDMNYSRGGIPIVSSENADHLLWSRVMESMSSGCCRVSYLVEDWCWDPDKLTR